MTKRSEFHNIFDEDRKLLLGSIQLIQNKKDNPKEYSGRGFIHYNKGEMILNLFPLQHWEELDIGGHFIQGQIISEDNYYELTATDFFGHEWTSERVSVYEHYGEGGQLYISGSIFQISSERNFNFNTDTPQITLYFPKHIKLPANLVTSTQTKIGEKIHHLQESICASRFTIKELNFFFINEDNYAMVSISGPTMNDYINVESKICESLEFILGREIAWYKYVYTFKDKELIKIRPIRKSNKINFSTPVSKNWDNELWTIFERYFIFVSKDICKGYSKLSQFHKRILRASAISIEAETLTLAILIEKIANMFFQFRAEVFNQKEAEDLLKLEKLSSENITSVTIKKRLDGFISDLKGRKISNLKILVESSLIESNLVTNWKHIRNSLAHGQFFDYDKLQTCVDSMYSLTSLYFQLIFLIIGYTGRYIDYSKTGFPQDEFTKSVDYSAVTFPNSN